MLDVLEAVKGVL